MMRSFLRFRVILIALLPAWLIGCSPSDGITVEDAWARPTPLSHSSSHDHGSAAHSDNRAAVYLTIQNNNPQTERLIHLSTAAADTIEIHQSTMDEKGIMRMKPQDFVDLDPGQSLTFEPGGYHLMLIGADALVEGNEFELTMTFESQQTLNTNVKVGQFGEK